MNSSTAKKIATAPEDDSLVKELAASLKTIVELAQRRGYYEDLFLSKKSILIRDRELPCEIELLLKSQVLVFDGRSLTSNVMLHVDPHLELLPMLGDISGIFIATDWPDSPPHSTDLFNGREMVFPLHYESIAVVREIATLFDAGEKFDTALDMFAGSGMIGIYAWKVGVKSITFADVSPRSMAFSMLNALMSGLEKASLVVSDCFQNIPSSSRFDLILGNPPFEPILPDDEQRYFQHSCGGRDGHKIMDRFLKLAPAYLAERGVLVTVDFLFTDDTGRGIEARISEVRALHPEIARATVSTRCYDQLPLRDFWVRYDALGIDRMHELRTELFVDALAGPNTIVLATQTIKFERDNHNAPVVDEPSFEDRPPPCPWWNPLHWPLPCGIGTDPKSLSSWFSLWSQREYETRSESGALYAELIASSPEKGLEHIDFPALLSDSNTFANEQMASALRSTALDARFLSIGSVQLPESVTLCLLPLISSDDAHFVKLDAPPLPVSIRRSRLAVVSSPEDIPLERPTIRDLHYLISQKRCSATSLILVFTISNPKQLGKSLQYLPYYSYRRSHIPHIGRFFLVWNGKRYEAPEYSGDHTFSFGELLHGPPHEVQRYLLIIDVSENAIKALEKLQKLGLPKWQKVVALQLGNFMRDRLTLLALPYLLATKTSRSIRDIIALSNAHSLRSALRNAVIDPLSEAIEDCTFGEDELRRRVENAISCAERVTKHLTLFLDGCAELINPEKRRMGCRVDASSIKKMIRSTEFNLESFGELPRMDVELIGGSFANLALPSSSFFALLQLVITNTIDAMHAAGLPVNNHVITIRVFSSGEQFESDFCKVSVWNSGTFFRDATLALGGRMIESGGPRKKRAGMGLHIVNTILKYAGAKEIEEDVFLRLKNTTNPDGAQLEMLLLKAREKYGDA